MIRLMLSIYDAKAEIYFTPFCVPTMGVAYRNLADEVAKKDGNPLSSHPGDFQLVEVGRFDEDTGIVMPLSAPRTVCEIADLVVFPE